MRNTLARGVCISSMFMRQLQLPTGCWHWRWTPWTVQRLRSRDKSGGRRTTPKWIIFLWNEFEVCAGCFANACYWGVGSWSYDALRCLAGSLDPRCQPQLHLPSGNIALADIRWAIASKKVEDDVGQRAGRKQESKFSFLLLASRVSERVQRGKRNYVPKCSFHTYMT